MEGEGGGGGAEWGCGRLGVISAIDFCINNGKNGAMPQKCLYPAVLGDLFVADEIELCIVLFLEM